MTPVKSPAGGHLRAVGRLVAGSLATAGVAWFMTRLPGIGQPPWSHPTELSSWLSATPPVDVAAAALAGVTCALGAYLSVVFALGALGAAVRARPLLHVADALSGGLATRLAAGSLTASLSLAALAGGPAGASTTGTGGGVPPTMAVLERPGGPAPAPTPAPTMVVLGAFAEPDATPVAARAASPEPTWTVQPGDHLWSIAETDLAAELGRAPTEQEVVTHWLATVELNRASLADPGNADLLFAGQTVQLPRPA